MVEEDLYRPCLVMKDIEVDQNMTGTLQLKKTSALLYRTVTVVKYLKQNVFQIFLYEVKYPSP